MLHKLLKTSPGIKYFLYLTGGFTQIIEKIPEYTMILSCCMRHSSWQLMTEVISEKTFDERHTRLSKTRLALDKSFFWNGLCYELWRIIMIINKTATLFVATRTSAQPTTCPTRGWADKQKSARHQYFIMIVFDFLNGQGRPGRLFIFCIKWA